MHHPTAIISSNASIGNNVSVGAYSIIHDNVILHDNVQIGAYCEIGSPTPLAAGQPLVVGKDSLIRSHSIFYEGSVFGDRLTTGHRVTVREKTHAGCNLQLGTLADVQGQCQIGDYVRLHSNVHIGMYSTIRNFVWIFPYVVLTNDPHPPSEIRLGVTIEDFAAIATMSIILPGVTVGRGALVGAHSSVNRDVPPDTLALGQPAKFVCETHSITLKDGSGQPAYPWRRHFGRGYPVEYVEKWLEEFGHARTQPTDISPQNMKEEERPARI